MKTTIRVGLIGFGIGGEVFHAPILTMVDGLKLVKIRVNKESQLRIARERYPDAVCVPDSDAILNDPDIDLVVITTPNTLHFPLAKQALENGKHVVVDKPFTLDTKEADELIALAARQKKLLSVFQSRRLDSDFKTVQKIIAAGLLGTVVEIESRFDRFRNFKKPNAWREENIPGAGVLFDLGSHLIDQSLTLFGKPISVRADIRAQRPDSQVDDHFEVVLEYKGLKVSLKAGMLVRESIPRFMVMGTAGSFVKYSLDPQEEALKAGFNPKTKPNWGIEPQEIWGTINTSVNGVHIRGKVESEKGDYVAYYQNIYDAITFGAVLQFTAAQGRDVIRIIELAMQSQKESATVPFTES